MRVPVEGREKGVENLFEEIITENCPHLGRKTDIQVQESHRVSNNMNPKRSIAQHIIIKMSKFKDRERIFILKASRKKSYIQGKHSKTIG